MQKVKYQLNSSPEIVKIQKSILKDSLNNVDK